MKATRGWSNFPLPFALAAATTLLAGGALLVVDHLERAQLTAIARSEVATRLNTVRARLEREISEPLARTRGLVAFVAARGDITQSEFDTVAAVLLQGHRDLRISLSRGTVIAMIYPRAGNGSAIGADYRTLPRQWPSVEQAIRTRRPVLNGPVPLIQGGTGLIARAPVFVPGPPGGGADRFFGIASVGINMEKAFAEAGLSAPGLPITVAIRGGGDSGGADDMILGDKATFAQEPVETDVMLPGKAWRLAGVPTGGWAAVGAAQMRMARLLGAGLILLAAVATFGLAFHITQRERAARALRARTLELERSNADLEQFAYVASHDLQTPLRNIVSYAQLLERRYQGHIDADADEFIGFIVDSGKRMTSLIGDLLEYSRATSRAEALYPVPAGEAVAEALKNLRLALEDTGAEITVGDLPQVMAERTHLVSLFQNLMENALKYRAPDRIPRLSVTAERVAPDHWRFAMADNGIGIEQQYLLKIFDIFQRLQPASMGEGTGIGLALCRRIVHRFGGTIWAESTPGQGATFFFTVRDASTTLA